MNNILKTIQVNVGLLILFALGNVPKVLIKYSSQISREVNTITRVEPAQAAVQTPIRSLVNPDYECVVYDESNTCYVWYNRLTGKYYDSNGNEVANPFP